MVLNILITAPNKTTTTNNNTYKKEQIFGCLKFREWKKKEFFSYIYTNKIITLEITL